ncbi:MAG: hypothetical protein AAFX80_14680, partial [Cyanobacteria bacterium J06639_18]
ESDASTVSNLVSPTLNNDFDEDISSANPISSDLESNQIDSKLDGDSRDPQDLTTKTEQQLEFLAQDIYKLLRQRLDIDFEIQGHKSVSYPRWLNHYDSINLMFHSRNNMSSENRKQGNNDEIDPLDNNLKALIEEVYFLLQQRLVIEKERW